MLEMELSRRFHLDSAVMVRDSTRMDEGVALGPGAIQKGKRSSEHPFAPLFLEG